MGLDEIDWATPTRVREAPGFPNILVAHLSVAPKPYVYVGRPMKGIPGSPLGNPYRPAPGVDAIESFRQWLRKAYAAHAKGSATQEQYEAAAELHRLAELYRSGQALTLACWCANAPCHADVIAEAIIGIIAQSEPVAVKLSEVGTCCVMRNPSTASLPWEIWYHGDLIERVESFASIRGRLANEGVYA